MSRLREFFFDLFLYRIDLSPDDSRNSPGIIDAEFQEVAIALFHFLVLVPEEVIPVDLFEQSCSVAFYLAFDVISIHIKHCGFEIQYSFYDLVLFQELDDAFFDLFRDGLAYQEFPIFIDKDDRHESKKDSYDDGGYRIPYRIVCYIR